MNALNCRRYGDGQQGISLLVVLILLLIMSVLGLAVLRGTLMQERMSANLLDRSLNFQAAEAALREGELLAQAQGASVPTAGSGCVNGLCEQPDPNNAPRWETDGFAGWRAASTSFAGTMASPSSFFVEHMGNAEIDFACNEDPEKRQKWTCVRPIYRIVARSNAAGRASVTLQSGYVVR
ncbi:MAG: PilX N-terminal domain-containing pilus assembly protein [Pseudomonadota bacterium]|nr:PilX N-terminal domain-containing pilus assembly protein [Pseudomonadota bacterium]